MIYFVIQTLINQYYNVQLEDVLDCLTNTFHSEKSRIALLSFVMLYLYSLLFGIFNVNIMLMTSQFNYII